MIMLERGRLGMNVEKQVSKHRDICDTPLEHPLRMTNCN